MTWSNMCMFAIVLTITMMGLVVVHGFTLNTRFPFRTLHLKMVRRDGESKDEYIARLQEAASDPVKFEKFVMGEKEEKKAEPVLPAKKTNGKGYQRIEDWDAERSRDDMSWEEKVQFDGQRFGNQFQQNEILRHNLKLW